MINDVKEVISATFEEVSASSLCLKLLNCYSILYLCGGQPGTCSMSQRKYYNQLKLNGLEMAEQFEEIKNRTCKPAWIGNMYVPKMARHYHPDYITDKEAINLLENGGIPESKFSILPDAYKSKKESEQIKEQKIEKRGRKPKKIGNETSE